MASLVWTGVDISNKQRIRDLFITYSWFPRSRHFTGGDKGGGGEG